MTPLEQVQQAYLHLCWAIKLDSYLQIYPPENKAYFDNPQAILDPDDPLHIPGNQFNSIDDILLAAENSISLSVGAFFIALDTALDEAEIVKNVNSQDNLGQLRILIFMCRCAFAHNILAPRWEVRGDYCRQLTINLPNIFLNIDSKKLSNKTFEIKDIGGYSQLFKIIEYFESILT